MVGKLIVIEGTDCSGKDTQSKLLIDRLKKNGIRIEMFSFPNYSSPTGKIIGGPFLGKNGINNSWFPEGPTMIDPRVSSLFYAADRLYNFDKIKFLLDNGVNIILDRYTFSSMAHQGGKLNSSKERLELYDWLDNLEFNLLSLPRPDISIYLHMPYECSVCLKKNLGSSESLEMNREHLLSAESAYMEIALKYNFYTIECSSNGDIRSIDDINNEIYDYVIEHID